MKKKFLTYALTTAMVGSLFTINVQAQEKDTDSVSLPVQLYDFDADGLFYEYSLYNGMDTFGLGESNNEGVTKGLLEDKLGDDGLPVYKQSSVEAAAKTIQENLAKGKSDLLDSSITESDKSYTSYNIFKHFTNNATPTDQAYTNMFGNNDDSKRFYNSGWHLDSNDSNIHGTGDTLHSGIGTIWQQEGDGIVNYGVEDHLTKVVNVEAGQTYKFDCWRTKDDGEIKFRIYGANDAVLIDNVKGQEFTPTTDTIKIEIYREGTTQGTLKISIPKLTLIKEGGDNVISENYLGDTVENNFLKNGWESQNYPNASKDVENGKLSEEGTDYWKQDGDGVLCLNKSSIVFNTEDSTNQMLKIHYWLDDIKSEYGSLLSVDILDDNGVLASKNISSTSGFNDIYVNVPQGTGNIKLRINGEKGSARIAGLSVTPLGTVLELGDYKQTLEKYNKGKLTKIEDCTTCMDYAYLRLKNFYNPNFSLNTVDNKYNQMILNKKVDKNGKIEYTFDSSKEIKYSDNSFKNSGSNTESSGFFPLDYMNSEKHSDKNPDNPQDHNYHFGMKVDGDFIYKKGVNQFFDFSGDDDVYVFINGELIVDLGGAHKEVSSQLDIEDYAVKHGIANGEKCHFQMFYLERHTTASNCKIQTNLSIGNHAEYKFITESNGLQLPDEILKLTPIDDTNYYDGDTITILNENLKFEEYVDTINNGVWKFVGWDKESKVMQNGVTQFIGKWVFISNDEINNDDPIDDDSKEPTNDNKQNQKENNNQTEQVTPVISNNKVVQVTTNNKQQKKSSKVKTGDNTSLVIYGTFVVISALGILFLKKKAHN